MRMTTPKSETRSALVIAVPEAEHLVSSWRERLDPAARLGVPAHITLFHPFATPSAIDSRMRAQLHDVLGRVTHVDITLHAIEWFGTNVGTSHPNPRRSPDASYKCSVGASRTFFPTRERSIRSCPISQSASVARLILSERLPMLSGPDCPCTRQHAKCCSWSGVTRQTPGVSTNASRSP